MPVPSGPTSAYGCRCPSSWLAREGERRTQHFGGRAGGVITVARRSSAIIAGLHVSSVARETNHGASSPLFLQVYISKAIAASTVAGTFLAAGNVHAAQEIADLAASDNRLGLLSALLLPALGWVRNQ
jgi:hypothetical protein